MTTRRRFSKALAFFDVDTQHDFMSPGGALYVRGSRAIAPRIRALIAHAAERRIRIFSSTDAHVPDDPEMQRFPHHCLVGTRGQQKLRGTLLPDRAVVALEPRLARRQLHEALERPQVVIEKQSYDVFDNPNTVPLLRDAGAKRFVVFGVATEYCVLAAVLGLRKQGYAVRVIADAIRGIAPEPTAKALHEMRRAGAKFVPSDSVLG